MKKILLMCSSGMSTSILVKKMEEAAKEKGIDVKIRAISTDSLDNHINETDVILLGPQIKFMLPKITEKAKQYNIQAAAIPMVDYGMCNGSKVLDLALSLLAQ